MLTIKEAAEYAGKSESWIRKKILAEELEAEKKAFKYGKRWETTKIAVDELLKQAKIDKEVVEVREVNQPIAAEDMINRILKATEEQNQVLIDEAVNDISNKIEQQNEQNKQDKEKIIKKLDKQGQIIEQQSKMIRELQQEKSRSLLDKIKDLFS